jgi:hypothetical protein
MTDDQAQRLIVLATIITLGSTVGAITQKPKKLKTQELKVHRVVAGGFFAMFFAAILAEADPKLGVGLAALVAGGAFFKYGLPTLQEGFKTEEKRKTK